MTDQRNHSIQVQIGEPRSSSGVTYKSRSDSEIAASPQNPPQCGQLKKAAALVLPDCLSGSSSEGSPPPVISCHLNNLREGPWDAPRVLNFQNSPFLTCTVTYLSPETRKDSRAFQCF